VLGPGLVPQIVEVGDGPGKTPLAEIVVHSERGSALYANLLAQLVQPDFPIPMGVLYRHDKPSYGELAHQQVDDATAKQGAGDLNKLMFSGMVWEVGADGVRH
jgi:2-oxoglutarate ferredoxin oxidoreductase subunit beta